MDIKENLMTFGEAAKLLPRRPAPSTLWRWHRKGVRGIKLEALRLGGRIYTSPESLNKFGNALATATDPPTFSKPLARSCIERTASIAAAKARFLPKQKGGC